MVSLRGIQEAQNGSKQCKIGSHVHVKGGYHRRVRIFGLQVMFWQEEANKVMGRSMDVLRPVSIELVA